MTIKRDICCVIIAVVSLLSLTGAWASAAGTRLEKSFMDGGKAIVTFSGSPIKAMTEVPFSIELYKASGEAVKDASLQLSMTMPFMPMPPNHPAASRSGETYRGSAVFTMAGPWQLHVEVVRPGAAAEEIVFDIEMVVMQ